MLTAATAVGQQTTEVDSWDEFNEGVRDALERIWIPTARLAGGPQVRKAFREVVAVPREAVVRIQVDGHDAALGGVVGKDGWILSKASCLRGDVTCQLSDGRRLAARIVGVDRRYDLAMLKVDAAPLPVLELNRDAEITVGNWVATVGVEQDPAAVGIVSAAVRAIPHRPGILGVQLAASPAGPRVLRVFPETGAAEAGIRIDDVIEQINGEPTATREHLQREIRRHNPGDEIEVSIRRAGEAVVLKAVLTGMLFDRAVRGRYDQELMSGPLSRRRYGFPQAFQHDTVLKPTDCGGPLVDLESRVLGFNIARAGRAES